MHERKDEKLTCEQKIGKTSRDGERLSAFKTKISHKNNKTIKIIIILQALLCIT